MKIYDENTFVCTIPYMGSGEDSAVDEATKKVKKGAKEANIDEVQNLVAQINSDFMRMM